MSEIKVNSIKGVGATDAAITVNNTDGTCTANLSNRQGKNLIINGGMTIAQRGVSSTASGYKTVDRFQVIFSGTDEAPTQAQVDVAAGTTPYSLGFRKALKVTNGNQTSGVGAADYIWIQTSLEAQDIANSGWNYISSLSFITLSFWIKSSVPQTFKGYLRSRDGTNQTYSFETGSLTQDTWTKVTKTISGNSNLTFDNNNEQGIQINLLPFMGTDFTNNSVTEDAWAVYSGSTTMKDNTSTWYTTNDATLEITGVQLEVGSVATDFEHRSFAQELALCQRYYFQGDGQENGASLNNYYGCIYGSGNSMVKVSFPTTMRAKPTVTTPSSHTGGGTFSSVFENFTEIVYYITGDNSVSIAPSEVKASAEL